MAALFEVLECYDKQWEMTMTCFRKTFAGDCCCIDFRTLDSEIWIRKIMDLFCFKKPREQSLTSNLHGICHHEIANMPCLAQNSQCNVADKQAGNKCKDCYACEWTGQALLKSDKFLMHLTWCLLTKYLSWSPNP